MVLKLTKNFDKGFYRYFHIQTGISFSFSRGFSIIEALVTLLVFSIVMVGTAGLMVKNMQVKRRNAQLIEAQNLAKSKLDQLTHVEFNLLGTGSTEEEEEIWGGPNGKIITREVSGKGVRSFVVCLDDADGGSDAGSDTDYSCADTQIERPSELSCDTSQTSQGEAQLKVLATFRTKDGKCHKFTMSQIVTNLQTE